ncbi:MAG: hypothetical protein ACRC2B_10780 [Rubrivivax sp.]
MQIGDDTLDWETLRRPSTGDDRNQRPVVQLDGLELIAGLDPTDAAAGRITRLKCARQI